MMNTAQMKATALALDTKADAKAIEDGPYNEADQDAHDCLKLLFATSYAIAQLIEHNWMPATQPVDLTTWSLIP